MENKSNIRDFYNNVMIGKGAKLNINNVRVKWVKEPPKFMPPEAHGSIIWQCSLSNTVYIIGEFEEVTGILDTLNYLQKFEHFKEKFWSDEEKVERYLDKIANGFKEDVKGFYIRDLL